MTLCSYVIARYAMVSSAKSQIVQFRVSGRSFMYRRNRHRPRTDPCSTLILTSVSLEHSPSSTSQSVSSGTTYWSCLWYHSVSAFPSVFNAQPCQRLWICIIITRTYVCLLAFRFVMISDWNSSRWVSHYNFSQKP